MKKKEEDFIKANEKRFNDAHAKAMLSIKQNAALVGLDKIRVPMAFQAALKACGYPDANAFSIPNAAGENHTGIQEIADRAFADAVAAGSLPSGKPNV